MEFIDYYCFNIIGRNFSFETQYLLDMALLQQLYYHIKQAQFVEHIGRFTRTGLLLTFRRRNCTYRQTYRVTVLRGSMTFWGKHDAQF
jgi:hypothetical protein